jgi:hypothetical protein
MLPIYGTNFSLNINILSNRVPNNSDQGAVRPKTQ